MIRREVSDALREIADQIDAGEEVTVVLGCDEFVLFYGDGSSVVDVTETLVMELRRQAGLGNGEN